MLPFAAAHPRYGVLSGPEKVANGNCIGDPLTPWTPFTAGSILTSVLDHEAGGREPHTMDMQIGAGQTNADAAQNLALEAGKYYQVSFWVKNIDSAGLTVVFFTPAYATQFNSSALAIPKWAHMQWFFLCVDAASLIYITVNGAEGEHARIKDISVREIL